MEDERLNNILAERDKALEENNSTYKTIMDNNQNLYNQQQDYTNTYENTQNDIARMNYEQNERLINQQKEKAQRETDVENQQAYNSYLKANNQYGTDVEKLGGLNNSGYSETYKMGTYNTYQNRVARANAALRDAFTEYDNQMYDAKKTYDVTKAQNALAKLEMQISYATDFNNNKNNALMNRLSQNQSTRDSYQSAYQNMMSQIQNERELAERIRQYNENMAYQRERDRIADEQWQKEYALSQYNSSRSSSGGSGNPYTLIDENNYANQTDAFGNDIALTKASDYYWKKADGTYTDQPSYINNVRLTKSGKTAGQIGVTNDGIGSNYTIWKGIDDNGNTAYYVWNNNAKKYLNVTNKM